MIKLKSKGVFLSNAIIFSLIIIVFAVSFIPHGTAYIYGGETVKAIYNGNVAFKNVSLMFNVYENTEVVNEIIDLLNTREVKATFFVGGCWADDNGETLNKIVQSGHELGNHGYFHKAHGKIDYNQNEQEIKLTDVVVKALCGVKMNLFAPPSGDYSETTLKVCSALNYKVIMWSKDTIDWRDSNIETIVSRATRNLSNGDLVLMHPKKHTLNALNKILDYYQSVNFNVVTVSENIAE